jgi:hypothetical protein
MQFFLYLVVIKNNFTLRICAFRDRNSINNSNDVEKYRTHLRFNFVPYKSFLF